jgi:type I restriction enzyme S subunit
MSTVGDALSFVGAPERINDPAHERFVTVKLYGGGAIERKIGSGKTPVPFTGYRVHSGEFIYSRIDARNGAFAVIPESLDGAVVSKDFPVFRIRSSVVDSRYLDHFFRSGLIQREIQSFSRGATNRQRIKEDVLLGFTLPLPDLDEQRRSAGILDRADALRAKRRQVLAHLDALPQSLFHAMFGGSKHKPQPIGSFASVRTGSTPSRDDPRNYDGSIPWVKTAEVHGTITETSEHVSEIGKDNGRLTLFPAGSVVVAMYGQGKTRGQSAILGIPATTNQACAVVPPNPRFDPSFLHAQMTVSYDRLRGMAEGGNQPNLNLARIKAFEVLLPPLPLQEEFARKVEAINAQRATVLAAQQADDLLFASLQSRAFRGEL